MPPSRSFWISKGRKPSKVLPLSLPNGSADRTDIFSVATRTKSGCEFPFFFGKYHLHPSEAKYSRHCQKSFFFDARKFLKATKFYRTNLSKKKKPTYQFSRSTNKKNFSAIGPTVLEKMKKKFVFSLFSCLFLT
jgi:hypothetical protein